MQELVVLNVILDVMSKTSVVILGNPMFLIDEFLELGEEPWVDFGEVMDFVGGEAGAEGVADEEDALGVGGDEFLLDEVAGGDRWAGGWRV